MPFSSSTTTVTVPFKVHRKLPMRMGEDLPIINFSTSKYVDAKTLSKIRSHAQQRVQDQRLARRTRVEDEVDVAGDSAARTSRDVVRQGGSGGQQSFTFVFEQQSGQHVAASATKAKTASRMKAVPKRKKKVVKGEDEDETMVAIKKECHSLSASPSERPDPFGAFPVQVDGIFLDLAENCKWSKSSGQRRFMNMHLLTVWQICIIGNGVCSLA